MSVARTVHLYDGRKVEFFLKGSVKTFNFFRLKKISVERNVFEMWYTSYGLDNYTLY